ncbi:MAG: DUF4040 domain-containing protein [Oscillibacter sp.]|nr:DUF4040 domain-containing protein [Oscillibacter sp.]
MNFSEIYKITLVLLLIVCAVSVNLTRSLLRSVIIFMSYSSIMCLLWILMESPDLAITEAAVGAGVSGYLFLVTLKKLRQIEGMGDMEQVEGGAWTDAAPETDTAPDFPEGGASAAFPKASRTQAAKGKRKRRRGKGGGKRKGGGA